MGFWIVGAKGVLPVWNARGKGSPSPVLIYRQCFKPFGSNFFNPNWRVLDPQNSGKILFLSRKLKLEHYMLSNNLCYVHPGCAICVQEQDDCGFLNALLVCSVHIAISECIHIWKRLGEECGRAVNRVNLTPDKSNAFNDSALRVLIMT